MVAGSPIAAAAQDARSSRSAASALLTCGERGRLGLDEVGAQLRHVVGHAYSSTPQSTGTSSVASYVQVAVRALRSARPAPHRMPRSRHGRRAPPPPSAYTPRPRRCEDAEDELLARQRRLRRVCERTNSKFVGAEFCRTRVSLREQGAGPAGGAGGHVRRRRFVLCPA